MSAVGATWPLGRREWASLALAFVVVVGVFTAAGILLTETFAPNAITELDQEVAEAFVDGRTPTRTDWAHWGAFPAETVTKLIASAVLVVAVLALYRRWHEPLLIAVSLIFEASAFIVVTHLVGRERPGVPRLLDSPVTSSYPSGHVAAATVYLAVVVIVAWNTRSKWLPGLLAVLFAVVVVAVAWARMYQGMHHLSDVVIGVVLGLVTLGICTYVISHSTRAPRRRVDAGSTNGAAPVRNGRAPAVREAAAQAGSFRKLGTEWSRGMRFVPNFVWSAASRQRVMARAAGSSRW